MRGDLQKMGINSTTTSWHTPKSNSMSGKINGALLDKVRYWLKEASVKRKSWGEELGHAVYFYNRTVTPT